MIRASILNGKITYTEAAESSEPAFVGSTCTVVREKGAAVILALNIEELTAFTEKYFPELELVISE